MRTAQRPIATASSSGVRTGKPKRWRFRRIEIAETATTAIAAAPHTQLQKAPMVPLRPPPISWKVSSSGATVAPWLIWKAALRKKRRPPSVTTKEGTPP